MGQGRSPIPQVDSVEPDLADQGLRLDHPRMVVVADPLDPLPRSLEGHRAQPVTAASVHAMNVGVDAESQASLDVLQDRSAQRHALAVQHGQVGTAHARALIYSITPGTETT
jgi:hypothetical protein